MRQPIQTETDFDSGLERVTEEYVVEFCGERTVVPVGTLFDGASIPRLLWWIAGSPYQPRYKQASAVHDLHYEAHEAHEGSAIDRKTSDRIYAGILIRDGVSPVMACLHYVALRAFGWLAW